jgi:hypothetical protein
LRILFDHNVDRRFRRHLPGHEVRTTREKRWDKLENGDLLQSAALDPFDAFLSIDKNIEHEQNLKTLPLPVIVIDSISNALPALVPFAPYVLELLQSPLEPLLYIIKAGGSVLRLSTPR